MDYRNIKCIAGSCKDNDITMQGAGGQIGGRISIIKVKCPECGLTLMIVPMNEEFEYQISATTEAERKQNRIKQAIIDSELALAKTITEIRKSDY